MNPNTTFLEHYLNKWKLATEQGNHEKALAYAIAAYLVAKEIDEGIEGSFLLKMELSAAALQGKSHDEVLRKIKEEQLCSFCGRSGTEVDLLAGAGANICKECAAKTHELFTQGRR
jgi:hypothetical protein